ncbi:hypothetical protein THUN1379_26940 [Paludibacterium sp. THUN1379]|uniref:hypothetical protein n=1 Tax=Paludibacterium sp. THUN1379 TaxID=3112107 RepID=UPI0030873992|nr:hypothetical protein THUN1379_26940 [Paludibacterium sp. THUN1379]
MKNALQNQSIAMPHALQDSALNTIRAAHAILLKVADDHEQVKTALANLEGVLLQGNSAEHSGSTGADVISSLLFCLYENGSFSVASSGEVGLMKSYMSSLGRAMWPDEDSSKDGTHVQ